MVKGVFTLFLMLALTVQLNTAARGEDDSTDVDDFSRCKKIRIHKLHVDGEVCVKIAYVKEEVGISIAITWDGKEIFKTKISAKEPPPFCFSIPMVKSIKACLKLTNVSFEAHHRGACLSIEITAVKVIHRTFKLGCIYRGIEGANSKNPLQILQAVKDLVNTYDAEKTGNEKSDWWKEEHDEPGTAVEKQVPAVSKVSQTCSCPRPSQCICCKNIALSTTLQTKVCGKVAGAQKGQGLWVSLMVNEARHFRVFTPVSRRFKFACSKAETQDTKSFVCLQLEKVVQTKNAIDVCLSAVSPNRLTSLGCTKVTMEDEEKPSDDWASLFAPRYDITHRFASQLQERARS